VSYYARNRERILERLRIDRRAAGICERTKLGPEEREQRRRERNDKHRLTRDRERERLYKRNVDPEKRRAQNRASYWRNHDKELARMLRRNRRWGIRPFQPKRPKQIKLRLHRYPTKAELRADARKKYRTDPEYRKQKARHGRQWRRNNPDRARANARAWQQANPAKVRALRRKRRMSPTGRQYYRRTQINRLHRLSQAIPPWADMGAIETFYAAAPDGTHVDHIIPIATKRGSRTAEGFLVCGLHCEDNLQYLGAKDNSLKGDQMRAWEQDLCEGRPARPASVELPQLALDL
jgi:hypothetical protein